MAGLRTRNSRYPKKQLQLDDSAAGGYGHRLSAIIGAELAHDVLDMNLDRFLRDEKPLGYIPIAAACGGVAQDLHFTIAESLVGEMLRKA